MTKLFDSKKLRDIPLEQRFAACPAFLQQVINAARVQISPRQIMLFGSRARGYASRLSDFDVAFIGIPDDAKWARFVVSLQENAETLLSFDLVNFAEASGELKTSILREGIVIYESSSP